MEEKTFRIRPNFFDIVLVVLVIAAALGAYLISHGGDDGEKAQRSYKVTLMGVADQNVDSVAIGDTVIDKVKNLEMGVVTDIEIEPATTTQLDKEAMILREVPMEGYSSVILTIETTTVESEYSINTTSGYLVRVGVEVYCSAGSLVAGGYLTEIER